MRATAEAAAPHPLAAAAFRGSRPTDCDRTVRVAAGRAQLDD
jgi:hypothetical protein